MKKRFFTLCLALLMTLQLCPVTALAADADTAPAEITTEAADAVTVPETDVNSEAGDWTKIDSVQWHNPLLPEQPVSSNRYLAGEEYQGELHTGVFIASRDRIVRDLRTAMLERKDLIYLYYETDTKLTGDDLVSLMNDALADKSDIYNQKEGDYLLYSILESGVDAKYIEAEGKYYNMIVFGVSYLTTYEQEQELYNKVAALRNELDPNLSTTVEERYRLIYDYISKNVVLDETADGSDLAPFSAYGALFNGKALPQGYAMLFYYMCQYFGLHNRIIVGTVEDIPYIWNIVKLHERWYNTDISADAYDDSYTYFLKGSTDFPDGHTRAADYDTPAFHAAHPMGETAYDPERAAYGSIEGGLEWSYNANTDTLTFSGNGPLPDQTIVSDMYGTHPDSPWFLIMRDCGSIVIEEGITAVGSNLFYGISPDTITLPDSLTSIGDRAFYRTGTKSIRLPAGLTHIGEAAFAYSGITDLVLPAGITHIGEAAFAYSGITDLVLPAGITHISKEAFSHCSSLTSVTLSDTLISIGEQAFSWTGIKSITLPDSLTSIGDAAFQASQLVEITIPRRVTSIAQNAFTADSENGVSSLTSYAVAPENSVYSSVNGLLTDKAQATLLAVPNAAEGSLTLPASIQTIGDRAFAECRKLTEITVPDGVASIGDYAFYHCVALTYIALPDSVTSIGSSAFEECDALPGVDLPKNLTRISSSLFSGSGVTCAIVPPKVTAIGEKAFNCPLTSLSVPASVTSIGKNAFGGNALVDIYYAGTEAQWDALTRDKVSIAYTRLHYGEQAISDRMYTSFYLFKMQAGTGVLKVNDPDLITSKFPWWPWRESIHTLQLDTNHDDTHLTVAANAFKDFHALTTIEFTASQKRYTNWDFRNSAFQNCTALTELTLPEGTKNIGRSAFAGCTALTKLTLPKTIYAIEADAFAGCTALTDVYMDITQERWNSSEMKDTFAALPNVTLHFAPPTDSGACGDNATWTFERSTGTLTISGSGKMWNYTQNQKHPWAEWEDEYHHEHITSIVVEDGITAIGNYAFSNLPTSTDCTVTLADSVTSIGKGAFFEADIKEIRFGNGLQHIGDEAFKSSGTINLRFILPESLKTIGAKAFSDMWGSVIYIPAGLQSYGLHGYPGNFETVYYGGSEQQWKQLFSPNERFFENTVIYYNADCVHILEPIKKVYPTCTATGLTEGQRCTVCEEIVVPQKVIAKTPHNLRDNTCIYCRQTFYVAFTDVVPEDYFFESVSWAVEKNVTSGVGNGRFAPNDPCTRGQVVTFLWRAKGCPEPVSTENPFVDVPEADFYYKAVLWAVENGVTSGTSATTFSPADPCTRGQVCTFLWRAMGLPEVTQGGASFTDMVYGAYYYDAVLWAVEAGVTTGIGNGCFGPDNTCTRGQIATFLYRALAEK